MELSTRLARPPRGVTCASVTLGGVPAMRLAPEAGGQGRVVLYLHGGGFTTGSPSSHRSLTGLLAKSVPAEVYALDYRLAPEHPFPAAIDDCVAAYRALLEAGHAPERVVVAGDSAGGNLALVLGLVARDAGVVLPRAIVAICPGVDLGEEAGAHTADGCREPMLTSQLVTEFHTAYAGSADRAHPHMSVVNADLRGLPPLVVETAEHDILATDTLRFLHRAREAGVEVTHREHKDFFHDFHVFAGTLPQATRAVAELAAVVRRELDRPR